MMRAAYRFAAMVLIGTAIGTPAYSETTDQLAIKAILNNGCKSWIDGKPSESVDLYVKDIVVFDVAPPRQKNHDQVVEFNRTLAENTVGKPTCVYEEIHPVILSKRYAYSYSILNVAGTIKGGKHFHFRERSTNVWQKLNGRWRCLHEHNSVPVDVMTGQADLESRP
jgi:ketosteroid isomerase-like protein